ncbi:hypothetical protein OH77DRAFT_242125 [Trametes cingulata]|nr:hypothetical protein OH77DRAFT_242125 [Trametes cingulata]
MQVLSVSSGRLVKQRKRASPPQYCCSTRCAPRNWSDRRVIHRGLLPRIQVWPAPRARIQPHTPSAILARAAPYFAQPRWSRSTGSPSTGHVERPAACQTTLSRALLLCYTSESPWTQRSQHQLRCR